MLRKLLLLFILTLLPFICYAQPTQDVGVDKKPAKEKIPAAVEAVDRSASVLLSPGGLIIEPSLEYTRSSAIKLAAEGLIISPINLLGVFEINQVDRDIITAALYSRVGITKKIEAGMRVPFIYRNDTTLSKPIGTATDIITEADGYGLGDIEVSGRYQFDHKNDWPFLIAGLRYKSITGNDPFSVDIDSSGLQTELPTGSGFHSLQPGITAIHPSDPLVFFGSAGYTINFERDINEAYGTIDPGDSINLGYGMGFSVNDKASFSMGYEHNIVFKTEQNGASMRDSDVLQVGSLNLGYAYVINKRTTVTLNLNAGLTNDAPDVMLSLKVPCRFNNLF